MRHAELVQNPGFLFASRFHVIRFPEKEIAGAVAQKLISTMPEVALVYVLTFADITGKAQGVPVVRRSSVIDPALVVAST